MLEKESQKCGPPIRPLNLDEAHLDAVIITVNLMPVVSEVPQAFIVHRENPRHPQHKNLSLLKKNSACKGWNDHLVACFIFRWRRRRRGWVAQFGAAMWSGLKYNSYTQPGERATLPSRSSLHSHPSFWGLTFPGNVYGTFNVG